MVASERTNMDSIYAFSMSGEFDFKISATDVGTVYEQPFSLFCKYHAAESEMDLEDSLQLLLRDKGQEHEAAVIESDYPDIERVRYETREEGFLETLRLMSAGAASITNAPLFYLPEGLHGLPDVLERRSGRSVWGDHHYVVKEIKLTSKLELKHKLQAAAYTMMIGRMQQYMPERFYITNGKGETFEYEYAEHEDEMWNAISLARRIRGGHAPPPIHGSKNYPWHNYTKQTAEQNNDMSLIPGIGKKMHHNMHDAGFKTVQDVVASDVSTLKLIRGIGDAKATDFLASGRAITTNKCIRKAGPIDLPDRSTEVFLDLEGVNKHVDLDLGEYLIGLILRKDGKAKYHSFIAEEKREDLMLEEFLKFMDRQRDYAIYHWGTYENTHMRSLMERHGMDGYHLLELGTRFDLNTIATKAFVFPTYSNSIKDVARWLKFNWRHHDVGTTSSMDLYEQYVENPESNRDKMHLVLDYNEDDCEATMIIKDWLVSKSTLKRSETCEQ